MRARIQPQAEVRVSGALDRSPGVRGLTG